MSNVKQIKIDLVTNSDDAEVTAAFERITARLGKPANIHRTWANSPALFKTFTAFAQALMTETTVDPLERQLAICVVLKRHRGDYEFAGHSRYAMSLGATEEQIANLCNPEKDELFTERQREVLRFARRFAADPAELDSLPEHDVEAHLDNRQRIELGMIMSIYMGISHFWALFDVPADT